MGFFSDVGIYGKLPSHGDFLRRRVSEEFVRVWDRWLQESLVASRDALADQWLDRYLTGPVWRFAFAGGVAGPAPVIGLLAPSVDRVGRYFPLTLVAELTLPRDPLVVAVAASEFLAGAERLVIETLATDRVDFDRFDSQVLELSAQLASIELPDRIDLEGADAMFAGGTSERWGLSLEGMPGLGPVFNGLVARHLAAQYDPMVIWWTEGSAYVEPGCVFGRGLPDGSGFASMLDGARPDPNVRTVTAAAGEVEEPRSGDTLSGGLLAPRFRSAAASDTGRVRSMNQDAFIERSDVGVWVVADGLGGHRNGEVASRMVCDALADFVPDAGFDQMIEAAKERLERVNEYLQRDAAASDEGGAGSTVVALFARGSRFAVLWAGDSRMYRLRDGLLEQVTEDHSLAAVDAVAASGESVNAITRAVGGEAHLALDQRRDRVRPGDRFLLCSDGLTRTVSEEQIARCMEQEDVRLVVDGLIQATLDNGAPDNVTALVVEAFS